jgi:hypothetical protein
VFVHTSKLTSFQLRVQRKYLQRFRNDWATKAIVSKYLLDKSGRERHDNFMDDSDDGTDECMEDRESEDEGTDEDANEDAKEDADEDADDVLHSRHRVVGGRNAKGLKENEVYPQLYACIYPLM